MGKLINLSGERFGKLKVIDRSKSETGHGKHAHWLCVCDCGNKTVVRSNLLRTGNTRSCGCLSYAEDLTGRKFGNLIVVKRNGSTEQGKALWECMCKCGKRHTTLGLLLQNGQSISCGCGRKNNALKHGLSKTKAYNRARVSRRKSHKLRNGGSHTAEQVLDLLAKQENKCYYCNKELEEWHQEHKTPLSRGGDDDISNIAISCPRCNLRKRDKTEEEFYTFLSESKMPA